MVPSGQQRDVCKNDARTFRKANPGLALAASCDAAVDLPLEGQRDAGEVLAKRDNIKAVSGSLICMSVKTFSSTEAHILA
jgi:hypothetical protein